MVRHCVMLWSFSFGSIAPFRARFTNHLTMFEYLEVYLSGAYHGIVVD